MTQAHSDARTVGISQAISGGRSARSRNLIILRAGDASMHSTWLATSGGKPHWDLHISYFGSKGAPQPLDGPAITWSHDTDTNKWHGIATALGRGMFSLDDYDYVSVPDDDVIATASDWNRAFAMARRHNLAACQASLNHASFFGYIDTLKRPFLELRYVSIIELMAPIIRVDVFKQMIPYLSLDDNIWGIDYVVASLLRDQVKSMAVLDAVSVLHTRKFWISPMYDSIRGPGRGLHQIEADFLSRHGLARVERRNLSGLTKGGRPIKYLWWTTPFLLGARMRRKYRSLRGLSRIAHAEDGRVYLLRKFLGVPDLDVDAEKVTKAR